MHSTASHFHGSGITDAQIVKTDDYFSLENIGSELVQPTLLGLSLCLGIQGSSPNMIQIHNHAFTHVVQANFMKLPKAATHIHIGHTTKPLQRHPTPRCPQLNAFAAHQKKTFPPDYAVPLGLAFASFFAF